MTDCTAPRHHDSDDIPEARPHAYLCWPCERQLRNDLWVLPELYEELKHAQAAVRKSDQPIGKAIPTEKLPYNDEAADAHRQIRHDVTWWGRHITEIRGTAAPPVQATAADWMWHPVKVTCGWLESQVRWITFRDWAADIQDVMAANVRTARHILEPHLTKQITWIATCENCETLRELRAIIYATEGDRRLSYIECLTCGTRWDFGPDWLRMAASAERISRHQQQAACA